MPGDKDYYSEIGIEIQSMCENFEEYNDSEAVQKYPWLQPFNSLLDHKEVLCIAT